MSASTRVQVLADKAEELSLLAEFLNNPKLISNLQEEVKKLNSLTAEEETKLSQARQDLKEHADKVEALDKMKGALDLAIKSHDQHVADCSAAIQSQADELATITKTQQQTQIVQDEKDKAHVEERKQLDAQLAAFKKTVAEKEDQLSKRESKVSDDEARNDLVRASIEHEKKKLAEKLRLLQAE